ncbi:MAG: GNAT family N-acetyltransferase [Candidatus Sulfotelmatobacter sp.]
MLKHRRASLFHTTPWLRALQKTYGYDAIACSTSDPDDELGNAIVLCRVRSWLTGDRLVSLPFSDHCEPLVDSREDADVLAASLENEVRRESLNYVEIRPLQRFDLKVELPRTTITYAFHKLDLRHNLEAIFQRLHKSSTQRKVRRAEREGLRYSEGTSSEFLEQFYRLFELTRRRHRLPPQPKAWFANLVNGFGSALKIRLASFDGSPVAAIMTVGYKDTLAYKYGCSDSQYNNLGSMHLLLWHAIQEAHSDGLHFLDFGRTDAGQDGLVTFKNRWGASQSILTYSRYGNSKRSTHAFDLSATRWKAKAAKYVLSRLPPHLVSKVGQTLYRHVG